MPRKHEDHDALDRMMLDEDYKSPINVTEEPMHNPYTPVRGLSKNNFERTPSYIGKNV